MSNKTLNDDGLEPNAFVTRDAHKRIVAEHKLAHQMVIRKEAPDLDTALSMIRD